MADAQCGELFAAAIEKWIVPIISAHLGRGRENGIEVSFAAMRRTTCRSGACNILCARTTVFSSAATFQAYPLALLVIRRGFGCVALSFAQRNLLVLLSLFFLAACACCPLSFSPVSSVIWLECHWILLCGGLISYTGNPIYARVRVLPALAVCPPRALLKTTLKLDATLRDVAQVVNAFSKEARYGSR